MKAKFLDRPPLQEHGFSLATLRILSVECHECARFNTPPNAEKILSQDLVDGFALANYRGWKRRKDGNHEPHEDAGKAFSEVEARREDWLRNLAVGKLSYYVAFVTREGLEAMKEIGRSGQSLTVLDEQTSLTNIQLNSPPGEPVQDTLARLHHENWENANSRGGYYHWANQEWGNFPADKLKIAQDTDRVQVDQDCGALAELAEEYPDLYERLKGLCRPSARDADGRPSFFHLELTLRVRNDDCPVVLPDPGAQFQEPLASEKFAEVIELTAQGGPAAERFYTLHQILDERQVPVFERDVIRSVLYELPAPNLDPKRSIEKLIADEARRTEMAQALCELVRDGEVTPALGMDALRPMVEERIHQRSEQQPQSALELALREPVHPSFALAFPAVVFGERPELDVRWQARWIENHLPTFKWLTEGLPPGGPCRPDNSTKEVLDQKTWAFRSELSLALLGILQGYRPAVADHLREVGRLMVECGVRPISEAGFDANRGVALYDGSFAVLNHTVRDALTLQYRAAALGAEDRVSAILDTHSSWKRSRMRAHLDPEPHASTWKESYLNLYALVLGIGLLDDADYQTVRSACSQR